MARFRALLLLLAFAQVAALAQVKLSATQVVDFVRNSAKKFPDKDIADYLKKVTLKDKLTDDGLEACISAGIGPKTMNALKTLAEKSATLAEPEKVVVKPKPVGPPPPPVEKRNQLLEQVTEYARNYIKSLPNFSCTQVTRRYVDTRNLEQYHLVDRVVETLSYFDGHEQYKVLTVNNELVTNGDHWSLGGTTSAGEFGTDMKVLFSPETRTEFDWESWTTLRGRRTHKFFYRVRQPLSQYRIVYEKAQMVVAGYKGYVYVDADLGMIVRITREAEDLPADFPVQNVKQITDYDFRKIGESQQEFLVPTASVITSRSGRAMVKNETEFTNYRKFGAESKIIFDTPEEGGGKQPDEEKPLISPETSPLPAPPPVKKKQ